MIWPGGSVSLVTYYQLSDTLSNAVAFITHISLSTRMPAHTLGLLYGVPTCGDSPRTWTNLILVVDLFSVGQIANYCEKVFSSPLSTHSSRSFTHSQLHVPCRTSRSSKCRDLHLGIKQTPIHHLPSDHQNKIAEHLQCGLDLPVRSYSAPSGTGVNPVRVKVYSGPRGPRDPSQWLESIMIIFGRSNHKNMERSRYYQHNQGSWIKLENTTILSGPKKTQPCGQIHHNGMADTQPRPVTHYSIRTPTYNLVVMQTRSKATYVGYKMFARKRRRGGECIAINAPHVYGSRSTRPTEWSQFLDFRPFLLL